MGDHLAISGGLLQAPLNPQNRCFAGAARSFRWARPPRAPRNSTTDDRPFSHRFRDKWPFKSKIANFSTPVYFALLLTGFSWNWVRRWNLEKRRQQTFERERMQTEAATAREDRLFAQFNLFMEKSRSDLTTAADLRARTARLEVQLEQATAAVTAAAATCCCTAHGDPGYACNNTLGPLCGYNYFKCCC